MVGNLSGHNSAQIVVRRVQDAGGLQQSVGLVNTLPVNLIVCIIAPVLYYSYNLSLRYGKVAEMQILM